MKNDTNRAARHQSDFRQSAPTLIRAAVGIALSGLVIGTAGCRGSSEASSTSTEQFESQMIGASDVALFQKAVAEIKVIVAAIDDYAINNGGRYPDSLKALCTPDAAGYTYLKQRSEPLDPWGTPYAYAPPKDGNQLPRVSTLGADGAVGGTGVNQDLSNFGLESKSD